QQLRATDPSRRGWEWRHLAAQSSHESQRIEHDTEILDVAWIDSERFLGFESAGEIGVWSVKSARREQTLANWSDTFRAFALDRERGLVVLGGDYGVGIWDYLTGRQLNHLLSTATPVHALAWSKDRRTLFVSRRGGQLDR